MTTPPARDPHPLADAWPPIEAAVFELWGVARPAIDALAAERGIPMALYNYAELGLDTLSVAGALRRDPYSRPEGFAEEFARLAADGWLEPTGGDDDPMTTRYVVLPHAREAVRALDRAGDARLGELVATPDADLERLHELLGREGKVEDVGWRFETSEPGVPLLEPKPLFTKLDDSVADEMFAKLGSGRST